MKDKGGTAYPSALFVCGTNDARVNPAHSRKMTERRQAATSSDQPILPRVTATAGHGTGYSLRDRATGQADIHSIPFQEPGMDASPWEFRWRSATLQIAQTER